MAQNPAATNKMKVNNQQGQTLIEACVALPLLFAAISGVFVALYFLLVMAWSDFWTYRCLICLVEQKKVHVCQKQLKDQLQILIPAKNFQIEELWLTKNKTQIKYRLLFSPLFNKSESKQIALPLIKEDPHYLSVFQ